MTSSRPCSDSAAGRFLFAPAVGVRIADDPDQAGLVRPTPWIAGQGHRAHGRAVVRAISGEELVAAGRMSSDLDCVFDRLGAAQREEHLVQVAGHDLGELLPEARPGFRDEGRLDELQLRRLCRDGIDHSPVAVADVDRHQLAVEVDDPRAVRRVQIDPLGVVHRDRVHGPLDGPREEGVLARKSDDLLGGHAGCGADAHRSTSLDHAGFYAAIRSQRWGAAAQA